MISQPKHVIGLSVIAAAGLLLNIITVASPHITSVPTDPIPSPSPRVLPIPNTVHPKPQATTPTITPSPENTPSSTPESSPTPSPTVVQKPTGMPSTEYKYSALPYVSPAGNVSASSSNTWQLSTINAPAQTPSSSGPIVAVIDTGFALNHTALSSHWWTNPGEMGPTVNEGPAPNCITRGLTPDKSCNNLDNDGDGYASDWQGWDFANSDNSAMAGSTNPTGGAVMHGTFVSGLIASNATASSAGVDQTARIMTLQALDDTGSGTTSSVADAVMYAADHGASVINLSLGSSSDDSFMHQAIDYAISKGAVIVAAAGNDGCNCMLYPANYPEVVAVGATDNTDTLATFSSYGANLDLVAPGQSLCSSSWTSSNQTSYYQCGGAGTSFAAPIISGVISRLIGIGGNSRLVSQFADVTADKPTGMGSSWRTDQYGTGRVNLGAALDAQSVATRISISNAIIKTTCSGTADCSLTIRDAVGDVSGVNSKLPTGQTSGIYWQTNSNPTTPTVWSVINTNLGVVQYYEVST